MTNNTDKTKGQDKPKNKGGRPTDYSLELSDVICERLAGGESMRSIGRDESMPAVRTMFRWLREKEEFKHQYEIAKEESADGLVEEMLEIADESSNDYMDKLMKNGETVRVLDAEHVQRSRLRIDVRKWSASKLKPKKYGDKQHVEHQAADGISFSMNFGGKPDTPEPKDED
tara:strand:- start:36140 stop:36655 length:516 start_codon:yes stop_codon:yes gene_type:complete